jgi:hypothetical protein
VQQFDYDKVAADGIALAITTANAIEPATRMVSLGNGAQLS